MSVGFWASLSTFKATTDLSKSADLIPAGKLNLQKHCLEEWPSHPYLSHEDNR